VTDNLLLLALLMALCPAPTVLVFFLIYRRHQARQASSQAPFQQMRRRPAGESLRTKLEEIDEQICEWLAYLAVCPPILGLAAGLIRVPGLVLPTALLSTSIVWAAVCAWKLQELTRQRTNYAMGFNGLRRVGEELNRLTAEGFEVYHDVPFDGFTIDHVLIGPPGVFAVETKTRRKSGNDLAASENRAQFDGFRVNWPTSAESFGLEHTVANAKTLEQWLTSAMGETIEVTPILTLPGWAIDYTATNPNVLVLSTKEIGKLCDSKTVRLPEDLIRRICHLMDRKCRFEAS
jgi:hypothetical protein